MLQVTKHQIVVQLQQFNSDSLIYVPQSVNFAQLYVHYTLEGMLHIYKELEREASTTSANVTYRRLRYLSIKKYMHNSITLIVYCDNFGL